MLISRIRRTLNLGLNQLPVKPGTSARSSIRWSPNELLMAVFKAHLSFLKNPWASTIYHQLGTWSNRSLWHLDTSTMWPISLFWSFIEIYKGWVLTTRFKTMPDGFCHILQGEETVIPYLCGHDLVSLQSADRVDRTRYLTTSGIRQTAFQVPATTTTMRMIMCHLNTQNHSFFRFTKVEEIKRM